MSSPSSSFDRERHSSSSSRLPSSTTNPTTLPISLDALLAQHANAPNPHLAALDQALSERNIFSTQNTQLWKLIEKQRAAYNQALKDLERLRAERDAYKSCLQAAGLSVDLGRKDRLRPLRPSASNATISSASENRSFDPRTHMVRHPSDTSASRHDDSHHTSLQPQDLSGRGFQPPHSHFNGSPNLSTSSATAPAKFVSSSQVTSSAQSASLLSSRSNETENSHTRPPTSVANIPQGRSPQQPFTTSADITELSKSPHIPVQHTSNAVASSHPSYSSMSSVSGAYPATLTSHSSSAPASSLLSPVPGNLKSVNRDSDVSLPDEARQYIANIESPLPSPGLTAAVSYSGTQLNHGANASKRSPTTSWRAGPRDGDESEFLELEEEGDQVEGDDEQQYPSLVVDGHEKVAETDDLPTPSSHGPPHLHDRDQNASSRSTPTSRPRCPPGSEPGLPSQTHWQSQSDISVLSQSQSSMESTLAPHPDSPSPDSYLFPTKSTHGFSTEILNPTFRALPLIAADLKTTRVTVSHSSIRPNDRGKEVLSFEIEVDPGKGKEPWKVEKLYSDVLGLDHRLRAAVGKGVSKKIASLPEGKLWKDHAPAKSDQRKAALELYLQSLIDLPVKNKDEVIAFFTSDVVRDAKKPVMQAGHKEGYLTKRGKNFGGWKTRYFVLQGPVLEYYESRGGTHLGSIVITNAQIGRQQRTTDNDDEKNYRHAFLIIEAKKGAGGSSPHHVLCAESDFERDSWVDILVRYVSGTFNDESLTAAVSIGPSPISVNVPPVQSPGSGQPRSSVSSNQDAVVTPNGKRGLRIISKDDISRVTISQDNSKLFHGSASFDEPYASSPTKSVNTDRGQLTPEEYARKLIDCADPPLSSSLPITSPLEAAAQGLVAFRSSSELGHYADIDRRGTYSNQEQGVPDAGRSREARRDRKSYHPGLAAVSGSPTTGRFPDRASSPDHVSMASRGGDLNGKVKISGPLSGAPIPAGYKFGGKDAPTEGASSNDRREKAKSRSFWNFGRPADRLPTSTPRAVFGVALDESLDVAEIARLPAVVFRSIQYLETKKAEQEEGIYRLSGSSAVIKGLKDRFNTEGDVDLLASDEYWDPHAIAGLLKSFLRELPASILTRELHMRFLSVMDFVEPQERIHELSHLISSLPIANYSLLRALTAHLILIVQNSPINKMTMRNVGIVFSPTLGIPAGVFSLMLGEFNRVFNVDAASDTIEGEADKDGELSRRNSRQYSDAAADQLLGLTGRTLRAPTEETPSEDSDSISLQYESGNETTENDATVESSQTRSSNPSQHSELTTPDRAEFPATQSRSHAAHVAASRGLNIAIAKRGNRQSRIVGLPVSPRPPTDAVSSPVPSPMQTARQS